MPGVFTRPDKCKSADLVFQHVPHSGRPCGRSAGAQHSDKEPPENKQPRVGDKHAERSVHSPVSLLRRFRKSLQDAVRELPEELVQKCESR